MNFGLRFEATADSAPPQTPASRGLILPLTLFILALLGILCASFAFQVNANRAAVYATQQQVQLRLAADAGIQHALLLLRDNRFDPKMWYNNEELFHNQVVWSVLGDEARRDVDEELDSTRVTFRYSLVADDPEDDIELVRYGITDESSKLNVNLATREQLLTLFTSVLPDQTDVDSLADALIDWRDGDDEPGEFGAEADYYTALDPPYTIKNGQLETVEELLLIKGFIAQVLYGEDYNRNGVLDPNEDDGEVTQPIDNADGVLQRGVQPYLTVWSRDLNRSNDNINRVDLNTADADQLHEALDEYVDEEVIDYILQARGSGEAFTSPVQLLNHEIKADDKKDGGDDKDDGDDQQGGGGGKKPDPAGESADRNSGDRSGGMGGSGGGKGRDRGRGGDRDEDPDDEDEDEDGDDEDPEDEDDRDSSQVRNVAQATERQQPRIGGKKSAGSSGRGGGKTGDRAGSPRGNTGTGGAGGSGGNNSTGGAGGGGAVQATSPVTLDMLPALCDRTTAIKQPGLMGLINVNTAPRPVLRCLVNEHFADADVDAIIAARANLEGDKLATVAWLLTEGVISQEAMESIYAQITARSQQFTIESIGHGDHLGMVSRLQAVVELRGHVPQYMYYRDLTELGTYPIRGERQGDQVVRTRRR